MTRQQMFDTAARGVIAQGWPSVDEEGTCLYRGPNGLKCGVGHIIIDEQYEPRFDGLPTAPILSARELAEASIIFSPDEAPFLDALQRAHDDTSGYAPSVRFVAHFRERMRCVAHDYHLSPAVLDEPQPARTEIAR